LSWRAFREKSWFTMVPVLTAAATVTSQLKLGPLVTSPNFRHPLLLAKDLIAIDDISGGRVLIGVGAGGNGFDASVLGGEPWSASVRHAHFDEFTRQLDQLLREPASTIAGEFYSVVDSRQLPGPTQRPRPPLIVSALGPKSLALCAELGDGWVSYGSHDGVTDTFTALREQSQKLDEALVNRGRDHSAVTRTLLDFGGELRPTASYDAFLEWAGKAHELGLHEVVIHWPIPDSDYDCDATTFERIITDGVTEVARWK
jgi:alkanesulfonate monooxygenase SsuD/methylene tetrahydromethanopterin reductase-like flavin-dependent oxidoreductase (luciferase family)